MSKTIVVSAVNLRKGGTLTILRDCLEYLSGLAAEGYRVVALVHDKNLALYPGIEYIEIPWTVKSWALRLWSEYVTMRGISRKIGNVDLWLSLHDTTPNVKARHRAVYCHNPYPFYQWKWRELLMNYHIVCFAWFSRYIYRINIHKNSHVLVQQLWIKKNFQKLFGLDPHKIIVTDPRKAYPEVKSSGKGSENGKFRFLFPSFGDIHKNFEIVCEAARLLEAEIGLHAFTVALTVAGDENKYTRWLRDKWGDVKSIEFLGFLSRQQLFEQYELADCLIFPSRVETWGLPISEFTPFRKPMLLADLPYAHETGAGSVATAFFNPNDAHELKDKMKKLVEGDRSELAPVDELVIPQPVTRSWKELFDKLLDSL